MKNGIAIRGKLSQPSRGRPSNRLINRKSSGPIAAINAININTYINIYIVNFIIIITIIITIIIIIILILILILIPIVIVTRILYLSIV